MVPLQTVPVKVGLRHYGMVCCQVLDRGDSLPYMEGSSECIEFCSTGDNQHTGLLIQLVGLVMC